MITLKGIRKLYRADNVETAALANVNLQIDKGEFVAVMGPSGCGKSTLMNIVGMIDTPNAGEYLFCGENVAPYPESRLVEIRRRQVVELGRAQALRLRRAQGGKLRGREIADRRAGQTAELGRRCAERSQHPSADSASTPRNHLDRSWVPPRPLRQPPASG